MKHLPALLLLALAACGTASAPASPAAEPTYATLDRRFEGVPVRVHVRGLESATVTPATGAFEEVPERYDVIIVGGGLSGLAAAWTLRDKKITVLERKGVAGGLSFRGVTPEGVIYNRGSAYYSRPSKGGGMKIYKEMGLTPIEQTAISEPIDSFWRKGRLIRGVWEEEALHELPDGFRKFKEALLAEDAAGRVYEQPMEECEDKTLDKMSAAEFIKPYGAELKAFLDSYCQSALGGLTDDLNALAFCNFYLAEVETRYAWEGGTAGAGVHMVDQLNRHDPAILQTGAMATKVKNDGEGVVVEYEKGGRRLRARAKAAILAVPLVVTSSILEGYPEDRKRLVANLKYADYLVHTVFLSKDHFTASYDTWFADCSFTDVIATRWQETTGFTKPGKPGPGLLSIYQPLAPHRKMDLRDAGKIADMVVAALGEVKAMVPELAKEKSLEIESYRWPQSIHIVPPGFFSDVAPKLTPPIGRVYFAANNLGTPSFEEALYRGHRAATEIRKNLLSMNRTAAPLEHAQVR